MQWLLEVKTNRNNACRLCVSLFFINKIFWNIPYPLLWTLDMCSVRNKRIFHRLKQFMAKKSWKWDWDNNTTRYKAATFFMRSSMPRSLQFLKQATQRHPPKWSPHCPTNYDLQAPRKANIQQNQKCTEYYHQRPLSKQGTERN